MSRLRRHMGRWGGVSRWYAGILVWALIAITAPSVAGPPASGEETSASTARSPDEITTQAPTTPPTSSSWLEQLDEVFDFEISAFGALLFVLLGVLLFGLFRWVHYLTRVLPLAASRRANIRRALPFLETLVALVYILTAVPMVFKDHPHYSPLVLSALIAGVVWVSWFAIRDVVVGLVLKAGGVCKVGDWVRLDEVEGRVIALSYRVMELESQSGETSYVPYGRVSQQAIGCTPAVKGLAAHAFTLACSDAVPMPRVKRAIRAAALNHHWASLIREPRIAQTAAGQLDITVYALEPENGPGLEAIIRRAVDALAENAEPA